jgi:hypothetical protein
MNKTRTSLRKRIPLQRDTIRSLVPEQLTTAVAGKMNPTRSCEPDCPHPIEP